MWLIVPKFSIKEQFRQSLGYTGRSLAVRDAMLSHSQPLLWDTMLPRLGPSAPPHCPFMRTSVVPLVPLARSLGAGEPG